MCFLSKHIFNFYSLVSVSLVLFVCEEKARSFVNYTKNRYPKRKKPNQESLWLLGKSTNTLHCIIRLLNTKNKTKKIHSVGHTHKWKPDRLDLPRKGQFVALWHFGSISVARMKSRLQQPLLLADNSWLVCLLCSLLISFGRWCEALETLMWGAGDGVAAIPLSCLLVSSAVLLHLRLAMSQCDV